MKKKIFTMFAILCFACAMFISGCGSTKVVDGVEYDTYGFINESEKRNPNIEYEFILGNAVWGVLLSGTVIAPIYFYGFSLYEPVGKKDDSIPKGAVR